MSFVSLKKFNLSCRDELAVESSYHSCSRPGINSQHPTGSSKPSVTLVLGIFSGLSEQKAHT